MDKKIKRAFIESDPFVLPLTKMEFEILLGVRYSEFFETEITRAHQKMDRVFQVIKTHDEIWFNSPLMLHAKQQFLNAGKFVLRNTDWRGKKIFNLRKSVPDIHLTRLINQLEKERDFQFFFGDHLYTQYPVKNLEDLPF